MRALSELSIETEYARRGAELKELLHAMEFMFESDGASARTQGCSCESKLPMPHAKACSLAVILVRQMGHASICVAHSIHSLK